MKKIKIIFENILLKAVGNPFNIIGKGIVYQIKNPIECNDFNHLKNHKILINDIEYTILGVEAFMHSAPWKIGELIGLLVNKTSQ